ncbi:MAG TPA: hypothetical protein VMU34_13325 [Mycobacterium sp.]|nr:hypothetical protein [Mycobacterium sp.]
MRELRDTFSAALIMYGAPEIDMLRHAEEWSLQTSRRQESFDQASGAKTLSSHPGSTLDYRGFGVCCRRIGSSRSCCCGEPPGIKTEIPEWTQVVAEYDRAVNRVLAGDNNRRPPQNLWEWLARRHQKALAASRNGQR